MWKLAWEINQNKITKKGRIRERRRFQLLEVTLKIRRTKPPPKLRKVELERQMTTGYRSELVYELTIKSHNLTTYVWLHNLIVMLIILMQAIQRTNLLICFCIKKKFTYLFDRIYQFWTHRQSSFTIRKRISITNGQLQKPVIFTFMHFRDIFQYFSPEVYLHNYISSKPQFDIKTVRLSPYKFDGQSDF